jgi:proliferating cell nuclear antigen
MLNVTARQDLMSKIIDTLGVVVEDAKFEFKEDRLQATVVDASHVAMIELRVDAAAFETWEVEESQLAVELKKIKELISLGSADDHIEMAFTQDVLTLNLGKIDLNLRPLDPSTINSPNLPNIEIPSTIEINGSALAQALRASRLGGDLVNFSIDANTFTVHVQGQPDSVNVSFSKDDLESLNCSKPARSQYSLTYLVPLSKVFGSLGTVKLGFGESFPLRLEFSFNDGAAEVVYFLAPRVESDY